MEGRYAGTHKDTGKSLDAQVCHVWKVQDGKVTSFQQYVDTAQLRDVMGALGRSALSSPNTGSEVRMYKYEIIIYWSDEDGVFVAEVPELPGCTAHGDTPAEALSSCDEAISLWIDTAKEAGRTIPVPKGRRLRLA